MDGRGSTLRNGGTLRGEDQVMIQIRMEKEKLARIV